jgi:hypothetical protein
MTTSTRTQALHLPWPATMSPARQGMTTTRT